MEEPERLTIEASEITAGDTPQRAFRITPSGEIDVASALKLEAAFDAVIEARASIVVLDASSIDFIDSTGLRSIVAAGNRLNAHGGRLLIEGMSGAVQRVLEVTGLIDRYRE